MRSKTEKRTYLFYFILIVAACISFVFTNVSYDAEYQLAMAYRLIKGDEMITQMWEPHQTSAFLCAILMKIYMVITGTTTGIVLYTQIMGLLIRGLISFLLFKTIKDLSGEKPALIAGVLYLLISPKELLTPEFGNMQLWFTTLLFLSLIRYFRDKKPVYLVFGAISLCLGVFSYPSVIITYIAVFVILLRYSEHWKRDIMLFTCVCAVIGGTFVGYLLVHIGLETILNCLDSALSVEPTHTVNLFQKTWAHILNIGKIIGMLAATGVIGFILDCFYRLVKSGRNGKKEAFLPDRWILISWFVLMAFLLLNILSVKNRGGYAFPFVVILALGFWKRGLLSAVEKRVYYCALWISLLSLVATLLLSDNAFLQAITYMLILICVSIVPVYYWYKELCAEGKLKRLFVYGLHLFLLLILFRCVYIHIPIYGRGQIYSILENQALVRSGPALGIITDEEGAARQRDSMAEWKWYVQAGDTIWILGEPVDTLGYLYEDVEVGAPTVMSTPTYNSSLLYYWEINPEKYPDVVILSSGYGELAWELSQNEWLLNWLEEEFNADLVVDGNFWRYYIRRR